MGESSGASGSKRKRAKGKGKGKGGREDTVDASDGVNV
jgi:hypothetical protein